ncbi:hypothetical protein IWQ56_001159 [Coemansia nantahalensis]|nr:hypothetical protein IWQ56_001159 [Coemansia nantahalensis]
MAGTKANARGPSDRSSDSGITRYQLVQLIEATTQTAKAVIQAAEAAAQSDKAAAQVAEATRISSIASVIPYLDDDPVFLERWIATANRCLKDVPDADKFDCVERKVRGPIARQLLYVLGVDAGFENFCAELLDVLDPDHAREMLYCEVVAGYRYRGLSPAEALVRARADYLFLSRGRLHHMESEHHIIKAVNCILPEPVAISRPGSISLKDFTRIVKARILKNMYSFETK